MSTHDKPTEATLVERLRELIPQAWGDDLRGILFDAADEIERLRARLVVTDEMVERVADALAKWNGDRVEDYNDADNPYLAGARAALEAALKP